MPSNFQTPGVYIEEKNAFPSSAVAVETAVPVFIGYTETATWNSKSLVGVPTRVTSFAEYVERFGGGFTSVFKVSKAEAGGDPEGQVKIGDTSWQLTLKDGHTLYLFNSIRLFYANGGSVCYIISLDAYKGKSAQSITAADFLDKKIYDALKKEFEPTLVVAPDVISLGAGAYPVYQKILQHCQETQSRFAIFDLAHKAGNGSYQTADIVEEFRSNIGNNALNYGAAYHPWLNTTIVQPRELSVNNLEIADKDFPKGAKATEALLKTAQKLLNILPPSAAMAGVYTAVDSMRGVWKAPANVSVNAITVPTLKISDKEQEGLNVDVMTGKSINIIRSFPGMGNLVWGARTLDGNSQDWRYVNVRRTLIMIEQSLKLATRSYVFEPNDANTWTTIKSMMDNFLYNLWKQGALAGATPTEAYDVQVGLGSTMTPADILDGMMLISVKLAIIRPAEFIVITFQQQMQQS